jgi:chromosomal replication initiation ATPase DnaA
MCAEFNYMAIPGVSNSTNRARSKLFTRFEQGIIIKTVCDHFNKSFEELRNSSKARKVVYPRQVIMYFLSEYTDMTYLCIGKLFGRDHTTVIHSKDLIKNFIKVEDGVSDEIDKIKQKIINNHI